MESWTDLTVIGTKSSQLLPRPRVLIFDPVRSGLARLQRERKNKDDNYERSQLRHRRGRTCESVSTEGVLCHSRVFQTVNVVKIGSIFIYLYVYLCFQLTLKQQNM